VIITAEAGRVLGCLVEKERTTPQQYPLTLNALTLACNQATNRDPVVNLEESDVLVAVDALRQEHLVRVVLPSHGRSVNRYRHVMDEFLSIDTRGAALVALLMLRGPQTPGELRARVERMDDMPTVSSVQVQLDLLASHPEGLVSLLPRRPGQKEDRWQQHLAQPFGVGTETAPDGATDANPPDARPAEPTAIGSDTAAPPGDIEALRAEVAILRASLAELSASFDELRRSLGG
jgi:uncharacterized protein YceH (UPF0502 family)